MPALVSRVPLLVLTAGLIAGPLGCGKSSPATAASADASASSSDDPPSGSRGSAKAGGADAVSVLTDDSAQTPAADPVATMKWLETVRDIRLEFYCKLKYGGGRNLFDPDPRQIKAKWDAVRATVTPEVQRTVDQAALRYFAVRAAFETLVQDKEKEMNERVMWWAVRHVVEDKVGENAVQAYKLLPKDAVVKQDLRSVLGALTKAGLELREAAEVLGLAHREMGLAFRKHYPDRAAAMLATVDSVYDPIAVGSFEKAWLERTRPDLLRRLQIEGRRVAAEAKASLDLLNADRYAADGQKFGGQFAAIYRQHANWVAKYEAAGLGFLAGPSYQSAARAFPPALREAMRAKAATLDPAAEPGLFAFTLQLSTFSVVKGPTPNAPPRVVVHPEASDVLPGLAKALGPKVGFLGEVIPGEPTVALTVTADGSKLVSIGKRLVEAIDLKTGKPGDPIVLPAADPVLESVGASRDGGVVFTADQRRRLRKWDLARGQEDTRFGPVTLTHNDPALAVSPDGKWVAASGSNNVQVYDAATGQEKNKFFARGLIQAMTFDRDSKTLLIGGQDRVVNGYDPFTGQRLWFRDFGLPSGQYVSMITRTADDFLAVGGSDHFAVWKGPGSVATAVLDRPMPGGMYCRAAGLTADRKGGINEHGVYELGTGAERVAYSLGELQRKCAVLPDGKRLAFFARGRLCVVPVIVGPDDAW